MVSKAKIFKLKGFFGGGGGCGCDLLIYVTWEDFFNAFPPESCGVNDNPSVATIRWWWSYGAIGYKVDR